jgi:hypothetical protein
MKEEIRVYEEGGGSFLLCSLSQLADVTADQPVFYVLCKLRLVWLRPFGGIRVREGNVQSQVFEEKTRNKLGGVL